MNIEDSSNCQDANESKKQLISFLVTFFIHVRNEMYKIHHQGVGGREKKKGKRIKETNKRKTKKKNKNKLGSWWVGKNF